MAAIITYDTTISSAYAAPSKKDWTAELKAHEATPLLTDDLDVYHSLRLQKQRIIFTSGLWGFEIRSSTVNRIEVSFCFDPSATKVEQSNGKLISSGKGEPKRESLVLYKYAIGWLPSERGSNLGASPC